jgi:hypothetical protein
MELFFRCALFSVSIFIIIGLYILWNDKRLTAIPSRTLHFSPKRWNSEDARMLAKRLANSTTQANDVLPARTGRKYIIVGGVRSRSFLVKSTIADIGEP